MPKEKVQYERITWTDSNGKRWERKGRTLPEAIAKMERLKLQIENGEVGISGNVTFQKWADEWLETYKENQVGEGQYQNYKSYLKTINKHVGTMKLSTIREIDLQKILNSQKGKSKSYLNKLRSTIQAIFKRARLSRLISYNPAENLDIPSAIDGKRRSLTPDERSVVLTLAETHHAGLWIEIMLYCGLRPAETRALDWKHIDFDNKLIHVVQSMKAATKTLGTPKSVSGTRDIPIPNKLFDTLKAAQGGLDEPVLTQPTTSKRHTAESMRCLWNNFKRELDISIGAELYRNRIIKSRVAPDLVPYCLRHTYCTDLQDAGVPLNIAKYLMGHSSIEMTANIYTHTSSTAIADAAGKINEFLDTPVAQDEQS